MKIIIPMTGYGSRFVAAGYKELKPFIVVQGRPILSWIVNDMYSSESNFLFVCRKQHLEENKNMRKKLLEICPTATICEIDDWEKKGPVNDVLRASEYIDDTEECIINYCDFYQVWDYMNFKEELKVRQCDGCIPTYTGYHPHLQIEKNVYASCKVDDNENLVEIREKFSFEKDKTKTRHSSGVYYFRTGYLLKKYCRKLVEANDTLNGEFYASLPYNYMVRDGLTVWVPANIEYFCQWGTPEDLADFNFWNNKILTANRKINILMPMAGEGSRFKVEGYIEPKPLIQTIDRNSGNYLPMVICATNDVPGVNGQFSNLIYIDRDFHKELGVEELILKYFSGAAFVTLNSLTDGQASTCLMAKKMINNEDQLIIAACDNGMVYNHDDFWKKTLESDVLVFTYRNNSSVLLNPDAYGWVIVDELGEIIDLSIKQAISDNPLRDHAIVGTFWFRKGSIFVESAEKMINENDRVNGEYYVDEVVKHAMSLGYKCDVFEIDRYLGWGTPSDYENYMKTYKYWQNYLHKIYE